ncbi:MAG: ABC transporter permease subunit [Dongiaceae bacterium]
MKRLLRHAGSALGLLFWIGLWELVGRSGQIRLLPPFSDVVASVPVLLADPGFVADVRQSILALALGLVLALAAGIPVGILMARSRPVDKAAGLWVDIFLATPLTALVPALMVLFGFGMGTVIATVVLFSIWVIILDTRAGILQARPSLVDMARAFGAKRRDIVLHILIPAALPEILVGLRLAVIAGVKGVVVGQILVAVFGIGRRLMIYSQNFLMDRFWALMICILCFAYLLVLVVSLLERQVAHYAPRR